MCTACAGQFVLCPIQIVFSSQPFSVMLLKRCQNIIYVSGDILPSTTYTSSYIVRHVGHGLLTVNEPCLNFQSFLERELSCSRWIFSLPWLRRFHLLKFFCAPAIRNGRLITSSGQQPWRFSPSVRGRNRNPAIPLDSFCWKASSCLLSRPLRCFRPADSWTSSQIQPNLKGAELTSITVEHMVWLGDKTIRLHPDKKTLEVNPRGGQVTK